MIVTQPTQEQVDRIAREFAPDVVRIRFYLNEDWSGDPAIYFKVLLSNDASHSERLRSLAPAVRERLYADFGREKFDRLCTSPFEISVNRTN